MPRVAVCLAVVALLTASIHHPLLTPDQGAQVIAGVNSTPIPVEFSWVDWDSNAVGYTWGYVAIDGSIVSAWVPDSNCHSGVCTTYQTMAPGVWVWGIQDHLGNRALGEFTAVWGDMP